MALLTSRAHGNNIVNAAHSWLSDCRRAEPVASSKTTYALRTGMNRSNCAFVTFGVLIGSNLVEAHSMGSYGKVVKDVQIAPIHLEFMRTVSYLCQLLRINPGSGVLVRVWNAALNLSTKPHGM